MKIRNDFFLADIGGDVYLLPSGQAIASFSHGVKLQGAGRILAESMMTKEGASCEELVRVLSDMYGDSVGEDELEKDVDSFISELDSRDIFARPKGYVVNYSGEEDHFYRIAGLVLQFTGPECLIYENLFDFECEGVNPDMKISVYDRTSRDFRLGRIIVRNADVLIYDTGYEYGVIYHNNLYLKEVVIKKNGSGADMYLTKASADAAFELFLGLRTAFLVLAQNHGLFAIHSASALYRGGIVLFSGVSGAGKSTHSRLWEEHFGVDIMNGDLNLIGRDSGGVMVYGLPWCGTSGIYRPFAEKLHGVFFITQWETNEVREITGSERALALSNRLISPTWNVDGCRRNLEFALNCEKKLYLAELKCRIDMEAAEVAKAALDKNIVNA